MGLFSKLAKIINDVKPEINVVVKPEVSVSYAGGTVVKKESNIPNNIKDDYRKTLFLYSEQYATKIKPNKDYKRYIVYDCGITNPALYHQKLIEEGYFESSKLEDVLNKKNVAELKEIINLFKLEAKGKKDVLIKTLIDGLTKERAAALVRGYYSISEKGRKFMETHEDYIEIHKNPYQIYLEDYYNATKNDQQKRNFNDVAWEIMNKRTLLYQRKKEYSSMRFNYYHMANLLKKENKLEHAMQLYLYCLVVDLSGIESISSVDLYKSGIYTKNEYLKCLEYNWLNINFINDLIGLKDYYDDAMLVEAYSTMSAYLPFNVSSIEFIRELLSDAFNTAVFDFEKYQTKLVNNKIKKYLEM